MILKRILSKIDFLYERYLIKFERSFLMRANVFYKNYLRVIKGYKFSPKIPNDYIQINTTLKSREDINLAVKVLKKSKLNLHPNIIEKNWDSLIALNIILKKTDKNAQILDAGGQINSLILSWLYQFEYQNLTCLNLDFKKRQKRGNIDFIPGDLTKTSFSGNTFDVVLCLSVIEHGVSLDKYFEEMFRILKKGGLLITSTDYWEPKVEKLNQFAYGKPVFIYDKESIKLLLKKAYDHGFTLFGPRIDLNCQKKVVHWKKMNLKFTFLIFCLQKI